MKKLFVSTLLLIWMAPFLWAGEKADTLIVRKGFHEFMDKQVENLVFDAAPRGMIMADLGNVQVLGEDLKPGNTLVTEGTVAVIFVGENVDLGKVTVLGHALFRPNDPYGCPMKAEVFSGNSFSDETASISCVKDTTGVPLLKMGEITSPILVEQDDTAVFEQTAYVKKGEPLICFWQIYLGDGNWVDYGPERAMELTSTAGDMDTYKHRFAPKMDLDPGTYRFRCNVGLRMGNRVNFLTRYTQVEVTEKMNVGTGILPVPDGDTKVWGEKGRLHIVTPKEKNVQIISFEGRVLDSFVAPQGETVRKMDRGLFLIRMDEHTYKIRF